MKKRTKLSMNNNKMKNPSEGYYTRSTIPFWMRDRKNKLKVQEEDYDLGLSFTIRSGDEIDPPSNAVRKREYFLVWWIEPGREFWAPKPELGDPFDPTWNIIWRQRQEKHILPGFIHLEVLRRRDDLSPGTSGGIMTTMEDGMEVVAEPEHIETTMYGIESVSRVRIPLPRPGEKKSGRFGLVKSDGLRVIGQGYIFVTVQIEKIPCLI